MALLFMDSFDHYVTADITEKWSSTSTSGSGDLSTLGAVGRHSSNGFTFSAAASGTKVSLRLHRTLVSASPTIVVGLAINPVSAFAKYQTSLDPNSGISPCCQLFAILSTGNHQIFIRINTDGTLSAVRGPATTGAGVLLGTSSTGLTQGVYQYVETLITLDNAAGVVQIKINNTSVLNLTAQDTQSQATAAWNEVRIGQMANDATANGRMDMDDVYVLDGSGSAPWNTFLGDCRVDARLPTAPGATTGFTPSTGANWQNVDDAAPDDDTTYNSAASVLTDTFTVQDAPVAGATIYGVQHCIASKKTDAGVGTIAPVVRHSGVDNVGASISPGTSYAYGLVVQSVNPGTSAAWVEADFNAAEFGYKRLT